MPNILIISGPSGSGKGTLVGKLKEVCKKDLFYSVSWATRPPRDGEINGIHYWFHTLEEYEELLRNDGFLEYNHYCGGGYGTPRKPVLDALENGRDVLLEIDPNGMRQVVAQYPDAITVFINTPSEEIRRQRLINRGEDEKLEQRMAQGAEEIACMDEYRHVIINDVQAVAEQEFLDCIKQYIEF